MISDNITRKPSGREKNTDQKSKLQNKEKMAEGEK